MGGGISSAFTHHGLLHTNSPSLAAGFMEINSLWYLDARRGRGNLNTPLSLTD